MTSSDVTMTEVKGSGSKLRCKLLAGLVGVCLLGAGPAKAEGAGRSPDTVTTLDEQFFFPVQLNPGDSQTYNVWGELRSPAETNGRTLLVLQSGLGTDHRYWDFPRGPSFVTAAVDAGYAVLNLDKLGTGYSSRPPANALGYQQDVFALHQIVSAARSGRLASLGFSHIVLVGHSLGSTLIIPEAATYDDVDAIVLTGITHTPGSGVNQFFSDVIPAVSDPALSIQDYPADYFTIAAGAIGTLFYSPATSTPAVIDTNESIKTAVTLAEGTIPQLFAAQLGEGRITVPVLTVFGTDDALFGNTGTEERLRTEPTFYRKSPLVNVFAIPETGHSLSLSTTFPQTDAIIFSWLNKNIGVR